MSKGTILVIDDEVDLIELLRANLEREGFEVISSSAGKDALDLARRKMPSLILLDLMMPGMDGLEVCRNIRGDSRTSGIPVVMLTAKAAEADRIVGLELGADDYVTKPFSPRELIARVKAHLRRSSPQTNTNELRIGLLSIDSERLRVTYSGTTVKLTAAEFRILHLLAKKAGRVLSRSEIISGALGANAVVTDRTIDVHITSLRSKLKEGSEQLETVRGFGYRLKDESSE
jgi:two-component system phosphate regulon response regulator PhoB